MPTAYQIIQINRSLKSKIYNIHSKNILYHEQATSQATSVDAVGILKCYTITRIRRMHSLYIQNFFDGEYRKFNYIYYTKKLLNDSLLYNFCSKHLITVKNETFKKLISWLLTSNNHWRSVMISRSTFYAFFMTTFEGVCQNSAWYMIFSALKPNFPYPAMVVGSLRFSSSILLNCPYLSVQRTELKPVFSTPGIEFSLINDLSTNNLPKYNAYFQFYMQSGLRI